MRGQPCANEHDGRPPSVSEKDHGGGDTANHLHHAAGDEVHGDRQRRAGHAEIEVARDGEVAGECRILEMSHARRAHTGLGEPVVEPCGHAVSEVGAYGLMNRAKHLKQHEDHTGKCQGNGERMAALHGGDEHAHRYRECRRKNPSQQESRPPSGGQNRVRLRQDREELPLLAICQSLEHDGILPQNQAGKFTQGALRIGRESCGTSEESKVNLRIDSCRSDAAVPTFPLLSFAPRQQLCWMRSSRQSRRTFELHR